MTKSVLISPELPVPTAHGALRAWALGVHPLQDAVQVECMIACSPHCQENINNISIRSKNEETSYYCTRQQKDSIENINLAFSPPQILLRYLRKWYFFLLIAQMNARSLSGVFCSFWIISIHGMRSFHETLQKYYNILRNNLRWSCRAEQHTIVYGTTSDIEFNPQNDKE